jgi:hypothetical protein
MSAYFYIYVPTGKFHCLQEGIIMMNYSLGQAQGYGVRAASPKSKKELFAAIFYHVKIFLASSKF